MMAVIYAERGEYSDYCMKILGVVSGSVDVGAACEYFAKKQAEAWRGKFPSSMGDTWASENRQWFARKRNSNDVSLRRDDCKPLPTDWVILDSRTYRKKDLPQFDRNAEEDDWHVTCREVQEWSGLMGDE